jgi:hypothetical protein
MEANVVRTFSTTHRTVEHRLAFQDVFPKQLLPARAPNTILTIEEVMMAALQARTRSSWLNYTLDSTPLLGLVESLDEIVHVASKSQPPSRYLPRRRSDTPTGRTQIDRLDRLEDRLDRLPDARVAGSRSPVRRSRSPSLFDWKSPRPLQKSDWPDGPPTRTKSADFLRPVTQANYDPWFVLAGNDYADVAVEKFQLPSVRMLWFDWEEYLMVRMVQTGWWPRMKSIDRKIARGKKRKRRRFHEDDDLVWFRLRHVYPTIQRTERARLEKRRGQDSMSDSGEAEVGEAVKIKFPDLYQPSDALFDRMPRIFSRSIGLSTPLDQSVGRSLDRGLSHAMRRQAHRGKHLERALGT